MTSPAEGSTVRGTITLNVSAASSVRRVDYLMDGVVVAYDATASDFSERWKTGTVATGPHTLVARATLSDGSASDSAPVNFSVTR